MPALISPRPLPIRPTRLALIAEDDPTTLKFFQLGLKGLQAQGWDLRFASDGAEAMRLLSQELVDVLVTDLHMPGVDGYQLIAHSHAHYPGMPILVITGLPVQESHPAALRLGALQVFCKPVRMSLLMEEIVRVGQIPADGFVRGLPLASLLQLLEWEEKSCTLKIRAEGRQGHLYLHRGILIHAETGGVHGVEAAHMVLRWERPEIEFMETCRVEGSFQMPVTRALMEVAVRRDHEDLAPA